MSDRWFPQTLLLLGAAVTVVVAFQRLRIPSSLGYLLVGVLLGPHTAGPVIDVQLIRAPEEFGIVFLLFTISLSFSPPQIYASRHLVLGLGIRPGLLTTIIVGVLTWIAGLPAAAAFVVTAPIRRGERRLTPPLETRLEVGDVVVLFGAPDDPRRAERVLLG